MSYDIVAFEDGLVSSLDFLQWWEGVAQIAQSIDRPSTPGLAAFYSELIETYPPMNGPDAVSDEELDEDEDGLESRITDYSITAEMIVGAHAWSAAEAARDEWARLGAKHGVAIAFISHTPVHIQRPRI